MGILKQYLKIFLPVLMLFVVLPWPSWAKDTGKTEVGEVEFVMGQVVILRDQLRIEAKVGTPVYEHDHIKTGDRSRVRVRFVDHSSMQMGSHAESVIERYAQTDSGLLDSLLNLIEGRARFIVNKIRSSDSKYQIRMRAVLIGVRGTDILAQASAKHDHVALVEGRVELTDPNRNRLLLNRGHYVMTHHAALPKSSVQIPRDWLTAFIADVGTRQAMGKKAQSGSGDKANAPVDAIQQKMNSTMGIPSIIPQ